MSAIFARRRVSADWQERGLRRRRPARGRSCSRQPAGRAIGAASSRSYSWSRAIAAKMSSRSAARHAGSREWRCQPCSHPRSWCTWPSRVCGPSGFSWRPVSAHIAADHESESELTGSRCLHPVRQEVKDENAVLGGMAGSPEGLLLLALVIHDVLTGTGAGSAWSGPLCIELHHTRFSASCQMTCRYE